MLPRQKVLLSRQKGLGLTLTLSLTVTDITTWSGNSAPPDTGCSLDITHCIHNVVHKQPAVNYKSNNKVSLEIFESFYMFQISKVWSCKVFKFLSILVLAKCMSYIFLHMHSSILDAFKTSYKGRLTDKTMTSQGLISFLNWIIMNSKWLDIIVQTEANISEDLCICNKM